MQSSARLDVYQPLPPEADAHYAGKGVSLGAADKPIFWYRPKDGKSTGSFTPISPFVTPTRRPACPTRSPCPFGPKKCVERDRNHR